MAFETVNGAQLQCTFGTSTSALVVVPIHRMMSGNQPAANIMDHVGMTNVMPFGLCVTPSNPAVAAATAAAMGTLTPMPCIPMTSGPWAPGSPTILVDGMPALNNTSKCMCNWGGVISIVAPGQFTNQIA